MDSIASGHATKLLTDGTSERRWSDGVSGG